MGCRGRWLPRLTIAVLLASRLCLISNWLPATNHNWAKVLKSECDCKQSSVVFFNALSRNDRSNQNVVRRAGLSYKPKKVRFVMTLICLTFEVAYFRLCLSIFCTPLTGYWHQFFHFLKCWVFLFPVSPRWGYWLIARNEDAHLSWGDRSDASSPLWSESCTPALPLSSHPSINVLVLRSTVIPHLLTFIFF